MCGLAQRAPKQQYDELIFSRNDKVREILKHKGHSVQSACRLQLGTHKPVAASAYREWRECHVVICKKFNYSGR